MNRAIRLGACLLSGVLFSASAHAVSFPQTVFFGDSLTDAGSFGSKFTINGLPDSQVWAQDLAGMLGTQTGPYGLYNPSASPVPPDNLTTPVQVYNGTDYAQGGARMTSIPGVGVPAAQPLSTQVRLFLSAHSQLDSNALYAFWGGANDVFYQTTLLSQSLTTNSGAQVAMSTAAQSEVGMLAQLHGAGANYLMVLNLPDIGSTPATILQGIQAAGQAASVSQTQIDAAVGAATLALRQTTLTPQQAAQVQSQAIAAAAAQLGLPVSVVSGAVAQVKQAFSGLSQAFNLALAASLRQAGFGVIPLNIQALMSEVLADPARYGFTNVTGFACNTSSSLTCNAQVAGEVDASQRYFFADSVHPTPAAHEVLAEYAYSVLEAPQLIGLLPTVTLGVQDTAQLQAKQALESRPTASDGRLGVYVALAGTPMKADSTDVSPGLEAAPQGIAVGLRLDAGSSLRLLFLLGDYQTHADFGSSLGGFRVHSTDLGVYARWQRGHWVLTGGGSAGSQEYRDIHRNIQLGTAVRVERGRSFGHSYTGELTGGYQFSLYAWQMRPTLGLRYRNVHVDEYAETGSDSTAMHFGAQQIKQLTESAGWVTSREFETRYGRVEPRLAIAYHKELRYQGRSVSAGLVTLPGSFSLPVYTPGNKWTTLELGIGDALGSGDRVDLAVAGEFGRSNYTQTSASLSYTHLF